MEIKMYISLFLRENNEISLNIFTKEPTGKTNFLFSNETSIGELNLGDFLVDILNGDFIYLLFENDYCAQMFVNDCHTLLNQEKVTFRDAFNINDCEFRQKYQLFFWVYNELQSLDLNSYQNAVNKILLYKNDELNTRQRFYAYHIPFLDKTLEFQASIRFAPFTRNIIEHIEHIFRDFGITPNDNYNKVIEYIKKEGINLELEHFYEFDNFKNLLNFIIYTMSERNIEVKICPNCNKYFTPERIDTEYCDNTSPQDDSKTCSEYIKYQKYLLKTRTDEATRLYKQIYNSKVNKIKRCGKVPADDIKLREFMAIADDYRKAIKSQTTTEQEYIDWLKFMKAGGNENNGNDDKT